MIVLDENIDEIHRLQLLKWRIHARKIGYDLGRMSLADTDILPLLCTLDRPTLFTRDRGFGRAELCHPRYCLVVLDVSVKESARTIRRVLRHSEFNTEVKRMGAVLDVSKNEIKAWRHPQRRLHRGKWEDE